MSVLYDDIQMDLQEYNVLKLMQSHLDICMLTEYHNWINRQAYGLI